MTGTTRVKICGLTRAADAELATELGADAVGFILWQGSPRTVTADQAREIVRVLPPFVTRVGVFVNRPPAEVAALADDIGLDVVQLHGDEPVSEYATVGRRLIKNVALSGDDAVVQATALPWPVTPLVDAADPVRRGGTGRVADWSRAASLARARRIMLAGGLTSDNVGEAIRTVRPWAVDVSSGVEERPGIKSADRLRRFFAAVRAALEDV
jgi:phosphoribosylanthranilate isomerase